MSLKTIVGIFLQIIIVIGSLGNTVNGQTKPFFHCKLHPTKQFLITAQIPNRLNIWNYDTGKLITSIKWNETKVSAKQRYLISPIALDPDGTFLAIVGNDGKIRVWKWGSWELVSTLPGFPSTTMVKMGVGGSPLITTGGRLLMIWDPKGKKLLHKIVSTVKIIEMDPKGESLIMGFIDGSVHIRNLKNRKLMTELKGNPSGIQAVTMDGSRQLLITRNADDTMNYWDLNQKKSIKTVTLTPTPKRRQFENHRLIISSKGQYVATNNEVCNIPEGSKVQSFEKGTIPIGFSAGDEAIILLTPNETIEVRDLDTWKLIRTFSIKSKEK